MTAPSRPTLHDWQSAAVARVLPLMDADRNTVLVAPTGGGKTVMGADAVACMGRKTLWLAHRRELVMQAARAIHAATGRPPGLIMAGEREDPTADVYVASVQTVDRRGVPPGIGLVVTDECHHTRAETWGRVIAAAPSATVLGLTATPFRLDGKGLGEMFDEIVVAATVRQLVSRGMVVEPRVFAPSMPNMKGVRTRMGDYVDADAARVMSEKSLVGEIVDHWKRLANGHPTVGYAVTVEHARILTDRFLEAGIAADMVHGMMPTWQRDDVLARLARGDIKVLWNCMLLTEGWNLPVLAAAIIARPTKSLCLWVQMIGRIMRACPNKLGATVLDHAGNTNRLGRVTQDIEYTLDDVVSASPEGGKRCPACFAMMDRGATSCEECGLVFAAEEDEKDGNQRDIPDETDDELRELGAPDSSFEHKASRYAALVAEAREAGYKPAWANYKFKEEFGSWPLTYEDRLVDPATAPEVVRVDAYRNLAKIRSERGYKTGWPGWADYQFRSIFGVFPPRHWATQISTARPPPPATRPPPPDDDVPF